MAVLNQVLWFWAAALLVHCTLALAVPVTAATDGLTYRIDDYNFAADGMDSVKMGQECLNFVISRLADLGFKLPAHELQVLDTTHNMCSTIAQAQGVQYSKQQFIKAVYPLVRQNELSDLFDKYGSDKGSGFHNYGQHYHRHLSPLRSQPGLRYLELGTFHGASLRAFREYFPLAEVLVSLDIDPSTKQHEDVDRGMHVVLGAQDDVQLLADVVQRFGPFDVIIDDCSHAIDPTVASFRYLFSHGLKDGGLYIVEDTVAFRKDLAYFFGLVARYHNRWRFDGRVTLPSEQMTKDEVTEKLKITSGNGDHCVDPWKMSTPLGHSYFSAAVGAVDVMDSSSSGSLGGHGGGLLDLTAPLTEGGAQLPGQHYSDSDDFTVGSMLGDVTFSNSVIFLHKEVKVHWLAAEEA